VRVFLSHSTKDGDFVKKLAEEMRMREIIPWLCEVDIDSTVDFVQKINHGLSQNDMVVIIWSPEAAASKWTNEELAFALKRHVEVGTFLATLLLRDHPLPPLLETKIYFDCRQDQKKGTADLLAWLERQRDMRKAASKDARLQKLDYEPDSFTGREAFFEVFHTELVVKPGRALVWGAPGNGKTTLALKFAWRARGAFDTVIFHTCGDRPLAPIVNELANKIDASWISDPHEVQIPKIRERLASTRSLLVLDDVWREEMKQLIPVPNASVLVTSRFRPVVAFPIKLALSGFDAEEQRQYLSQNLPAADWTGQWLDKLQELARKYDGSPLALSTIVQQLQETYGPHEEALRYLHFSSIEEMLRDFAGRQPKTAKRLLDAVAVCAPQGVWLPFAARVAGMSPAEMAQARDHLVNNSLLRVVEREEQRYNLHALLHKALASDALGPRHAEEVFEVFQQQDWRSCQRCAEEVNAALDHWEGQDKFYQLALAAYDVFQTTGLLDLAFAFIKRYELAAAAPGDRDNLRRSYGNQAIILKDWGRLDEAMELHKKEEALCLELGDKDGLGASYGNQALILAAWGRLDEAMELHKKEEALCLELGNTDGLQRSYGNQARILRALGWLEESMELIKKVEGLCLELGDKDSLSITYGHQAIVLRAWGRLDEAMELHKKQEALCLELGSQRGFAYCYWHQGLVLQKMSRPTEARQKLTAALAIFASLKMPRQRDLVQKDLNSLDA
jgi:tetratricopeptide (TPR) repeat protein